MQQVVEEDGGSWACCWARSSNGWEAERVVCVTGGRTIVEMMTRAQVRLCIVLVDDSEDYAKYKTYFKRAERKNLIRIQTLE